MKKFHQMSAKKLIDKNWYIHVGLKLAHWFSVLIKKLVAEIEIASRDNTCLRPQSPFISPPPLIFLFKYLI